jgi:histidinol-phosphatase
VGRTDDLDAELALALELADRADTITLPHFRAADLLVEHKADRSEVTEADRGSESVIRSRLTEARPDHAVLGEEEGLIGPAGARARWIVDPIDGTRGFSRGGPMWGPLVAFEPVIADSAWPRLARRSASSVRTASGVFKACARLPACVRARSTICALISIRLLRSSTSK